MLTSFPDDWNLYNPVVWGFYVRLGSIYVKRTPESPQVNLSKAHAVDMCQAFPANLGSGQGLHRFCHTGCSTPATRPEATAPRPRSNEVRPQRTTGPRTSWSASQHETGSGPEDSEVGSEQRAPSLAEKAAKRSLFRC